MKSIFSFLGLFFFFAIGYYISFHAGDFNNYMVDGESLRTIRDPAAIKKGYDFSALQGIELNSAVKQRLLSGARVVHNNDSIGLELGHFTLRGLDGHSEFACQHYEKVIFTFEGEGVATGGEKPKMEVEGKCEISGEDVNSISAIWIPVKRILGETVADGELDYRDGKPIAIRFANVADQWPKLWQLQSVKLLDPQNHHREITISPEDFKQIYKKPFLVNFNEVQ